MITATVLSRIVPVMNTDTMKAYKNEHENHYDLVYEVGGARVLHQQP
jgi:hypothetical protein